MNRFWKDVGIAFTMGFIIPGVLLGTAVSFAEYRSDIPILTESIMITEPEHEAAKQNTIISVLDENGGIIINFNEAEVAPAYMGMVEFEIPEDVLADIRK